MVRSPHQRPWAPGYIDDAHDERAARLLHDFALKRHRYPDGSSSPVVGCKIECAERKRDALGLDSSMLSWNLSLLRTRSPRLRIEPFKVAVAEQVLSDLKTRIRNTRWPDSAPGAPWSQGTDLEWLRNVMDYWAEEFDWRAQEQRLGELAQFRIEIDGVRIHFVHARARGGRGIPLILTHGWPSAFVEYLPLVPLLTDPVRHGIDGPAFDLVIPSLPGYGFSERPRRVGANYRYVSALWHRLMTELEYERYGSGGTDFGSGVATLMALDRPDSIIGIHLTNLDIAPYIGPGSRALSPAEKAYIGTYDLWLQSEGGYKAIQSTRPQTLGYALNDSPAGLAAWIAEKWRSGVTVMATSKGAFHVISC